MTQNIARFLCDSWASGWNTYQLFDCIFYGILQLLFHWQMVTHGTRSWRKQLKNLRWKGFGCRKQTYVSVRCFIIIY